MQRKPLLWAGIAVSLAVAALTLTSCPDNPPDGDLTLADVLEVALGADLLTDGAVAHDFGLFNPDILTGVEVAFAVRNVSDSTTIAMSVTLSQDTDFTLKLPETGLTLAPGDTADVTLVFAPASSGAKTATITVDVTDFGTFGFDVTGEGNYPPAARFEVTIAGAGTLEVNGTYVWDGSLADYGAYVLDGLTPYYIYSTLVTGCGGFWYIADAPDGFGTEFYRDGLGYPEPVSLADWVVVGEGLELPPTTAGTAEGIQSVNGYFTNDVDNDLSVVFLYSDAEEDLAATADYQWQQADNAAVGDMPDDATWADTGTNSATYEILGPEGDKWIRVIITPHASAGLPDGQSVTSPPVRISSGC